MEEGDTASFLIKDPDVALGLAPKMCPTQSRAFYEVNNSQAFTVGRTQFTPLFWTSRFQVLQGMFKQSSRKYSTTSLRRINVKTNLTPRNGWTQKPSIYDDKP